MRFIVLCPPVVSVFIYVVLRNPTTISGIKTEVEEDKEKKKDNSNCTKPGM